jgi:outer membrane protein assembly factor BamE (lipoprotein component of BamABCDE complex)
MYRIFILVGFVCLVSASCATKPKTNESTFNKRKWRTSTEYRYEIMRTSSVGFLKGKDRKEVIKYLGQPNGKSEEDGVTYFKYCFSVETLKNVDKLNCNGSFMVLHFKEDVLVDITVARAGG